MTMAKITRAKPNAQKVVKRLYGIVIDKESDVKDVIAASRVLLQCGELGQQSDVSKAQELNDAIDRLTQGGALVDDA